MRMNNKSATIRSSVPRCDLMLSGSPGSGIKREGEKHIKASERVSGVIRGETGREGENLFFFFFVRALKYAMPPGCLPAMAVTLLPFEFSSLFH